MGRVAYLRSQYEKKLEAIDGVFAAIEAENREMTADEAVQVAAWTSEAKSLQGQIAAQEEIGELPPEPEPQSRGVRSRPPGAAPAAGTGRADQKPFSLMRCIRLQAEGRPLDGLEAEVSQEVMRRSGGRTFKGFAMPTSSDPEIRALMYPQVAAMVERRDLTTTTGIGTIFTVPKSFIELLRAKMVVRRLGVEMMEDMQGNFAIPRLNGTATVQWVGEGVSVTPTSPSFDQVPFTPKLALATTIITKQLMMQTSISAEEKVNKDLSTDMALEFDRVVFFGSGGAQPLGLANNAIIQSNSAPVQGGANGGPISYAQAVRMIGLIKSFNADVANMAYVSNSTVETSFRLTPRQSPNQNITTPNFVWEDTNEPGVGRVNGMRAFTTNLIPNNLTKGTSTNCSALFFGNWADLTVATWDTGVDMIVDPYTGKRSGAIEITMEMAMDVHPRHEASFAVISDITPT